MEEVPGPEPEEVVKMEPQDQMSEGEGGRRTQIQEQPQKENAGDKMTRNVKNAKDEKEILA